MPGGTRRRSCSRRSAGGCPCPCRRRPGGCRSPARGRRCRTRRSARSWPHAPGCRSRRASLDLERDGVAQAANVPGLRELREREDVLALLELLAAHLAVPLEGVAALLRGAERDAAERLDLRHLLAEQRLR